jgi:hypothetical protein
MFNFFGLKKKPVIEDVEVKVPTPAATSVAMTFDEALSAQAAADVANAPADSALTPTTEPEVLGQMDSIKATREDVIAAYKIFLGRLPESMEVVDPRVGVAPAALLVDFLASKEFLDQAPKSQLVLAVAKKILDERKQAAAVEAAKPSSEAAQPNESTQPAQ